MSSNLYIKPFANPQYREDLDEKTIDILYDSWWEKGEDLGEINYRSFWKSFWKTSGLVSIKEWLGVPELELRKGTLEVSQFLPQISQGIANALRIDGSTYFDAVEADGFLSDYEQYKNNVSFMLTRMHPQNTWEEFLERVLLQCHRHPDWYIYLD